jgi:hypothetical protein
MSFIQLDKIYGYKIHIILQIFVKVNAIVYILFKPFVTFFIAIKICVILHYNFFNLQVFEKFHRFQT